MWYERSSDPWLITRDFSSRSEKVNKIGEQNLIQLHFSNISLSKKQTEKKKHKRKQKKLLVKKPFDNLTYMFQYLRRPIFLECWNDIGWIFPTKDIKFKF